MSAHVFAAALSPFITVTNFLLTAIHHVVPSYGWTMIFLATIVRALLWPLSMMQIKCAAKLRTIQPEIVELNTRFADDRVELAARIRELYREHHVNPMSGCLPVIAQFPILIAVFFAIQQQRSELAHAHFAWIGSSASAHYPALIATSLAAPDVLLLLIYAITTYMMTTFTTTPAHDREGEIIQAITMPLGPLLTAYIGYHYNWSSAVVLYWITGNIIGLAQQAYARHRYRAAPALAQVNLQPVAISHTS